MMIKLILPQSDDYLVKLSLLLRLYQELDNRVFARTQSSDLPPSPRVPSRKRKNHSQRITRILKRKGLRLKVKAMSTKILNRALLGSLHAPMVA